MFERRKPKRIVHYEVVRIRVAKEWNCQGTIIPEHEVYPSDEKWGTDGFTFTEMEKAKKVFEKLSSPLVAGL